MALLLVHMKHFVACVVEAAEHLVPEGRGLVVHLGLALRQIDGLCVEGGRLERELPADVHAAPLEIQGDELHGAHTSIRDGLIERLKVVERRLLAPEAEPLHVRHVLKRGGARGRAVDHARERAVVLRLLANDRSLRRFALLGRARAVGGGLLGDEILGLVRLIEEDAALRLGATKPLDHLVSARLGRALPLGHERGVGGEENAVAHGAVALAELAVRQLGDVPDGNVREADVAQVALRILHQVRRD
mmetsp:Transcript_10393/g.34403  ORF Transcript_10393/g.34403 Transcript_10393/m.34403 type:complete len:247 (+) Transcript_10393:4402-5142(+)